MHINITIQKENHGQAAENVAYIYNLTNIPNPSHRRDEGFFQFHFPVHFPSHFGQDREH